MGSPDIRIKVGTPRHLKFRRLRKRLGPGACWAWLTLACYVGENRSSGDLTGMSDLDIAEAAEFDGDATEFVTALVDLGLLEKGSVFSCMHDWADHNPWAASAEERSENARKAGKASGEARKKQAVQGGVEQGVEHPVERNERPVEQPVQPKTNELNSPLNSNSVSLPSPSPSPTPSPKPTPTPSGVGDSRADDRETDQTPFNRKPLRGLAAMEQQALITAWESAEGGVLRGWIGNQWELDQFISQPLRKKELPAVMEAIPGYAKAVAEGRTMHANLSTFVGGMYRRDFDAKPEPPSPAADTPPPTHKRKLGDFVNGPPHQQPGLRKMLLAQADGNYRREDFEDAEFWEAYAAKHPEDVAKMREVVVKATSSARGRSA